VTTTFFLVRHAAHDNVGGFLAGRLADVALGADGRRQAERLARRMRRERIDAIHTSPRRRTRETAEEIARVAPVPLSVAEELDEIDFGESWCGRSFDDLNCDPDWRRWNKERATARTPAGESLADVQRRVVGLIRGVGSRSADGAVVLVSHADVIKLAVTHCMDIPLDRIDRFDIAPASVTTMVVGPWGSKLLALNEPAPADDPP
jgi:broad specificity phosphatase PhoE